MPPEGGISIEAALRALANDKRLRILEWLKDPRAHFRPQVDGDLVEDGVCGVLIAEKLGVSQPTASEHLRILADAGLVRGQLVVENDELVASPGAGQFLRRARFGEFARPRSAGVRTGE